MKGKTKGKELVETLLNNNKPVTKAQHKKYTQIYTEISQKQSYLSPETYNELRGGALILAYTMVMVLKNSRYPREVWSLWEAEVTDPLSARDWLISSSIRWLPRRWDSLGASDWRTEVLRSRVVKIVLGYGVSYGVWRSGCNIPPLPPVRPPQWGHEGGWTRNLERISARMLSTLFMWWIWRLRGWVRRTHRRIRWFLFFMSYRKARGLRSMYISMVWGLG